MFGDQEQSLLDRFLEQSQAAEIVRSDFRKTLTIADNDPEMALARARKLLEFILQQKFEAVTGDPASHLRLDTLLHEMPKIAGMPRRLVAYGRQIQELGNIAVHVVGERISAEDVLQALKELLAIAAWAYNLDDESTTLSGASVLLSGEFEIQVQTAPPIVGSET